MAQMLLDFCANGCEAVMELEKTNPMPTSVSVPSELYLLSRVACSFVTILVLEKLLRFS